MATSAASRKWKGAQDLGQWAGRLVSLGLALAVVFAVSAVTAQGSIAVFGDSRDNRKWLDTGVWEIDDFIPFSERYCYCDVSDPAAPSEVGRSSTSLIPQRIGVNRKDLKLVALFNLGVAVFDLVLSPREPQLEDQLLMIGGPWRELVVDDRWILTSGLVPRAAYYSPEHGLSHEGGHDLNAWVEGRELRGEEAYRVDDWQNRFEVWSRR